MKVVFIQYGVNTEHANMLVHSAKFMGYEVWQLSDLKAPEIKGVDKIERRPMTEGRMLFRAKCLASLEPPYVMMDTDMLIAKDIREGFCEADISITWRERHNVWVDGEKKPIRMPYNGGLVFVRNQDFMRDVLKAMEALPTKYQDWYGDQIALRDVVESGKYAVRELKDPIWNFVPDSAGHEIPGIKVWHFKGMRKAMMPARFKTLYT